MSFIEVPEVPVLRGERAIKALHDFIDELKEQRGKELTEKQTAALTKLAKGLISSIEAEKQETTSNRVINGYAERKPVNLPLVFPMSASPYWYATSPK